MTYAEVWIDLLSTDQGGRRAALDLCNDHPGAYRPHFRARHGDGELLGVEFVDGPDDPVQPGSGTFATVRFLYEPRVSYAALTNGAEFDVLEGSRIVGRGRITRLGDGPAWSPRAG
jgi:translation elongation factor EF-Tu-like GTPase